MPQNDLTTSQEAFFSKKSVWRIATLVLLVSQVVTALLFFFVLRLHHPSSSPVNPYPLVDPSRNIIPQEHYIVNLQPLRQTIHERIQQHGAENAVTLYFETLHSGANIIINPDLHVPPASLLKVPAAVAVMKKVERGEWQLDNKLVLYEQDVDPGYGNHYHHPVGTTFTIEALLRMSLTESDNTAHRILVRNLSINELAESLDSIGLNDLLNEERKITVREYSRIFRSLYYSSFLKREHSQQILDWLTQSTFNQYVQAGVPSDILIAHKIGEDDHSQTYLDSGIIYAPNRPYLLSMAVTGLDKEKAQVLMQEISDLLYAYVASY